MLYYTYAHSPHNTKHTGKARTPGSLAKGTYIHSLYKVLQKQIILPITFMTSVGQPWSIITTYEPTRARCENNPCSAPFPISFRSRPARHRAGTQASPAYVLIPTTKQHTMHQETRQKCPVTDTIVDTTTYGYHGQRHGYHGHGHHSWIPQTRPSQTQASLPRHTTGPARQPASPTHFSMCNTPDISVPPAVHER